MNTISLTVPMEPSALNRASEMLSNIAGDLESGTPDVALPTAPGKTEVTNVTNIAPTPPATTETAPTPPVATGDVDLDSLGLPWDVRINSKAKTKLAKDQSWKLKRGVDPSMVAAIRAELTKLMGVPTPTATIEVDDAAQATFAPTAVAETPTPPKAPDMTFNDFVTNVTAAITAGTLTNETLNEVLIKHGVAALPLLNARPDLIQTVANELFA